MHVFKLASSHIYIGLKAKPIAIDEIYVLTINKIVINSAVAPQMRTDS